MEELFIYWGGDERGNDFKVNKQDLPFCVPIATQTLHAAGIATAMKYRKEKRGVVTAIGDGGTSRGDFYEAINVAGVWKLPCVFVINNNGWAISVPSSKQTACETFAQKAIAAGIEAKQIDGNDVIGVRTAVKAALEKAYQGKGPTVIEALTYRLCDHTTADDAGRYRSEQELKSHYDQEPIGRLKKYLESQNLWDETKETNLKQRLSQELEQAVKAAQSYPDRKPETMFDHLYETLPKAYESQRAELASGGKY